MASGVTTDYLSSTLKVTSYDFDPNETAATDISWQDMRDFGAILIQLFRSVGTGSVSSFTILANPQSDGSGTDSEVKAHAIGSAPDAVGDYINLEALASEFPPLGSNLRYVSGAVSLVTATDECVAIYVRGMPRFAYGSLTADAIA
jgi:hypothetical protein